MADIASLITPPVGYGAIQNVRAAIKSGREQVQFSVEVPLDVAEKILRLLTLERTTGALVVPAKEEFNIETTSVILGISRNKVLELVDSGTLGARAVGLGWRISAKAILDYLKAEEKERSDAARRLALATLEVASLNPT